MNDTIESSLSVSTRYNGRRQSTSHSHRRSLKLSAFEDDDATVPANTIENSKEFTVQNVNSRHGLPDFSAAVADGDVTSSGRHDPWYYSANHLLINQERVENGLSPLHRRRNLDEKARDLAKMSAEKGKLKKLPAGCKGNVARGLTIREIHWDMMTKQGNRERKKILNEKYNAFGMGTHKGEDGYLYLVQLFEKTRIDQ